MSNLGILVIDMQDRFLRRSIFERAELIRNQIKLIAPAKSKEIPFFVMEYTCATKTIEKLRRPLEEVNSIFIKKYNDNAFIKIEDPLGDPVYNTDPDTLLHHFLCNGVDYKNYLQESELENKLKEKEITDLILTGINKYGCVLSTAREAKKRKYNLITSNELLNQKYDYHEEGEEWYKTHSIYFSSLNEVLDLINSA
jgi:nicotinamidase-related amidase